MPKINVTIAELMNTANALEEMNRIFISRVDELEYMENELSSMWQGEANRAFRSAFEKDNAQWAEFAVIISHYINSLRSIAQKYSRAEEQNTSTAKADSSSPVLFIDSGWFNKIFQDIITPRPHPAPVIPGIRDLITEESFSKFIETLK